MIGGVAVSRLMAGRKITPKNQKDSRQPLRFTSGEIVRTIDAVQAAGLTVYGVEITIKISTQHSPSVIKRLATPLQDSKTVDATIPVKKQA